MRCNFSGVATFVFASGLRAKRLRQRHTIHNPAIDRTFL